MCTGVFGSNRHVIDRPALLDGVNAFFMVEDPWTIFRRDSFSATANPIG